MNVGNFQKNIVELSAFVSGVGAGYCTFKFVKKASCNINPFASLALSITTALLSYSIAGAISGNLVHNAFNYMADKKLEIWDPQL